MKRRTAGLMMAMVLAVTILAGCGGKVKFEPQTSSIFVKKDGTVVSADMEDFIGNNYSETELKRNIIRNTGLRRKPMWTRMTKRLPSR